MQQAFAVWFLASFDSFMNKNHRDLDQVCLIWFEEKGIHLQFQFGQILWNHATKQDFDSSCFISWEGLQSISSRSKKFSAQGKRAFPLKGRNKVCSGIFTPVSCLRYPLLLLLLSNLGASLRKPDGRKLCVCALMSDKPSFTLDCAMARNVNGSCLQHHLEAGLWLKCCGFIDGGEVMI